MKTIKSTFLTKTFSFNFHFKWVKTRNKTHWSVATLEIYSCMLKSFTSYSYLTHSCTQRTYNTTKRYAFDEHFVFAHILRWTALISWGTRHKCKPCPRMCFTSILQLWRSSKPLQSLMIYSCWSDISQMAYVIILLWTCVTMQKPVVNFSDIYFVKRMHMYVLQNTTQP